MELRFTSINCDGKDIEWKTTTSELVSEIDGEGVKCPMLDDQVKNVYFENKQQEGVSFSTVDDIYIFIVNNNL